MTKALRKERKRHLDFIASLPIDEDAKNEAIQYILFLEKSKKEAEKVHYDSSTFYEICEKDTSYFLRTCFLWGESKQDASFWIYIINYVDRMEGKNA